MNQIGGFDKIKNMIPGLGNAKIPDDLLGAQQEKVAKWEHILKSMTPKERENPELLKKQTSRISRIADGAGVNNSDVRSLLKQYDMLQDMLKGGVDNMDMSQGFSQKQMQKMMKKFGKKKMMRFK
jgi:signal recognition particle subunit SRP54